MTAEEIAEMITSLFSPYLRYHLLKIVLETVRVPDLASGDVSVHSIRTALQRRRIGDELSFKLFKNIAKNYPHVLEYALDKELRELSKKYEALKEKIARIKEQSYA